MNTKDIGNIGEAKALAKFIELGIEVFVPFGDNSKADLVANFNGGLQKIQVKTCININKNGTYMVNLTNSHSHTTKNNKELYSKKDIDYFVVYCIQRKEPLLFSIEELLNKSSVTIRFEKAQRNGGGIQIFEEDNFFEKKIDNIESFNQKIIEKINYRSKNHCLDCGQEISHTAIRCLKCENKRRKLQNEKTFKFSREELKAKIRTISFTSIGKELHISDNSVRKWCDHFNLPRTKKDINSYSDEEWEKI